MDTQSITPDRRRAERRTIFGLAAIFFVVVAITLVWRYGPAYAAYWKYSPQEGDIVFQSLPHSRLVNAIEGATNSPLSHCGIVGKKNGRWVVFEAYRKVEASPLKEFIFRGRRHGFAVYRLKREQRKYIAKTISHVRSFLVRPYDSRYRMDDESIYCSELIYKGYLKASGQQLGELVRLGDLNWRPYARTIKLYEDGPVPLDRKMITPKDLAGADQLELVLAHRIDVASPAPDRLIDGSR